MRSSLDEDDSDDESRECKEKSRTEPKRRRSTRGSFNATAKRLHSKRDANSAYEIMLESIDSEDEMKDDTYTCK